MKTVLALALFVGVALSSSSSYQGWTPGRELHYQYETEIISGLPQIKDQYAGYKFVAEAAIQTFSDYTIRVQLRHPRFAIVNEELQVVNQRPRVPKATRSVPQQWEQHLVKPFEIRLRRGTVESLVVDSDEPVFIQNMKRAFASQLNLDLTAQRQSEVISNVIVKASTQQDESQKTFFVTEETTVQGDCETQYTVYKLPEYQALEIEQDLKQQEKELERRGLASSVSESQKTKAQRACEGKPYFEVTKTKNLDNCRVRPFYQSIQGVQFRCDASKASCANLLTHSSSSRMILCGQSTEEYIIRQISSEDVTFSVPSSYNTEENLTYKSHVLLTLRDVKQKSSDIPKPQQPKEIKSLIYEFPETQRSYAQAKSSTQNQKYIDAIESSDRKQLEQETEFVPLLPQPDMESASTWLPRLASAEETKENIVRQMRNIVSQLIETPEACSLKTDLAGYISLISDYLMPASKQELNEVQRAILSAFSEQKHKQLAMELFQDILAMTATNPAVSMIKENIQNGELSGYRASLVLSNAIKHVRTPTKQVFREVFQLIKSMKSQNKYIFSNSLVQLSNLVYEACVEPSLRINKFPVRVFGQFCSQNSSFITEEFVPFLAQEIQSEELKETERAVLIIAAGKIGQKQIMPVMAKIIEGKISKSPMIRSIAVYNLVRLARQEPTLVRPILMALAKNIAEQPEIRQAAIYVLPFSQPTSAELQTLAMRSWFEPSKQVASFIYSTLKSLQQTKAPELREVSQRAQGLTKLIKPAAFGIQYSKNFNFDSFIPSSLYSESRDFSSIMSEDSIFPSKVSLQQMLHTESWDVAVGGIHVYAQGIDKAFDEFIKRIGMQSEISGLAKEQIEKIDSILNIKSRQQLKPEVLAHLDFFGLQDFTKLDSEIVQKLAKDLAQKLRESSDKIEKRFNMIHAIKAFGVTTMAPTISGLPMMAKQSVPVLVSVHGMTKLVRRNYASFEAKSELYPLVSAKIESFLGLYVPFTNQLVAAGVDLGLHSAVATEVQLNHKLGQTELVVKAPENVRGDLEIMHTIIRPFTAVNTMNRFQPTPNCAGAKTIKVHQERQPTNMKLGRALGLDATFSLEHDYQAFDLSTVVNAVRSHSILAPTTVRYAEAKLKFNPKNSATKEIKTRLTQFWNNIINEQEKSMIEQQPQEYLLKSLKESQLQDIKQVCQSEYQTQFEQESCQKEQIQKLYAHQEKLEQELEEASQEARDLCKKEQELIKIQEQEQESSSKKQRRVQSQQEKEQVKRMCQSSVRLCEQAEELCQKLESSASASVSSKCHEKKQACLARQHTVRKLSDIVANKLQSSSASAKAFKVESSIATSYGSKQSAEMTVVLGQKKVHQQSSSSQKTYKTKVEVEFKTPSSKIYDIELNTEAKIPKIQNIWNLEALISEPIKVQYEAQLRYGSRHNQRHEVRVEGQLQKTEQQKQSIRASPEYQKCEAIRSQQQRALTPVCMEARNQAAALDKIVLRAQLPQQLKQSTWFQIAESALSTYLYANLDIQRGQLNQKVDEQVAKQQRDQELFLEIDIARSGLESELKYESPATGLKLEAKHIRLPAILRQPLPLSIRKSLSSRALELVSEKQMPATCEIEHQWISTFDNKTYEYNMNSNKHLLVRDCSGNKKIAVVAKASQSQGVEAAEIILSSSVVEVDSRSAQGSSFQIKVNREPVTVSRGQTYVKRSPKTNSVIFVAQVSSDNVLYLTNPQEQMTVFYDGKRLQIQAPARLFSRACGLCGDMNGENTAEVQSPRKCVLSKPRFNAYTYMINKSGIPSEDRSQFEREEQQCVQKRYIATPVEQLLHNIYSKTQTQARKHIVIKQLTKTCISKTMVNVCSKYQSEDRQSAQRGRKIALPFTCLEKNSSKTENILKRVEGGKQISELFAKPTYFTENYYEPISCGQQSAEYENQLNQPHVLNYRLNARNY